MARILIVDDDEYIRELYGEVLEAAGFEVDIATNGDEGLNKMQSGSYDLVLLDIMMPKMDGMMLLHKIQNNMPKYPIVLLTNLDHDPIREEGLSLGAKDYLIKADYTPKSLVEKIKTYIIKPAPYALTN